MKKSRQGAAFLFFRKRFKVFAGRGIVIPGFAAREYAVAVVDGQQVVAGSVFYIMTAVMFTVFTDFR